MLGIIFIRIMSTVLCFVAHIGKNAKAHWQENIYSPNGVLCNSLKKKVLNLLYTEMEGYTK